MHRNQLLSITGTSSLSEKTHTPYGAMHAGLLMQDWWDVLTTPRRVLYANTTDSQTAEQQDM